jgi:hypothetical protein
VATHDIDADPELMRAGALRLAGLADELAASAARCREIPLDGPTEVLGQRDELVAEVGRRVVDLALAADRLRREADALAECERAAAAGFDAARRVPG